MINNKEIQNIQRVYINNLKKRLNEALSPAGGGWGWTVENKIIINHKSFINQN
jgi:hypothetical protein